MKPSWWHVPTSLLGRPLPPHLRGWRLWLALGGECLMSVAEFLEEENASGRLAASLGLKAGDDPPEPQEQHDDTQSSRDPLDDSPDVGALIAACLEARDVAEQDSVRGLLQAGLVAAGVTEIDGTGERFDPEKHRAVTTTPSANPSEDGLVARTVRRGYAIGGRTLRLPEVAVFTTRHS